MFLPTEQVALTALRTQQVIAEESGVTSTVDPLAGSYFQTLRFLSGDEPLAAEDIAEAIQFIVTRPRRVAVNELLIRPTETEA
jgi:NADP-dependent 3-hydroxy acid dehydrogenase YdfG